MACLWPSGGQPFIDLVVETLGDVEAAPGRGTEPAAGDEHAGDGSWQRPGQVDTTVGPVDAGAGENPPTGPHGGQVDIQPFDQMLSAVGELVVAVVEVADGSDGQQPVAQLHAAASGQVVVTGAGLRQRASGLLTRYGHRGRRGNLCDALQHRGACRGGDLVGAVPPLDG